MAVGATEAVGSTEEGKGLMVVVREGDGDKGCVAGRDVCHVPTWRDRVLERSDP
jgi:hypothetical protein